MNLTALSAVANTVRSLSIDAVEKAESGHPVFPWGALSWAPCCTESCFPTGRRTRSGSTGTALSCPRGTGACSCIRFCTFQGTT